MFSATIGKKVKDLMKVNLKKEHEYISIHNYDSVDNKEEKADIEDEVD